MGANVLHHPLGITAGADVAVWDIARQHQFQNLFKVVELLFDKADHLAMSSKPWGNPALGVNSPINSFFFTSLARKAAISLSL